MSHNRTKIVFDSNSLWKDDISNFQDIFNTNLEDLVRFIKKHQLEIVDIVLPEVVIQERLTQYSEIAEDLYKKAENSTKKLGKIGIKYRLPKTKPNLRKKLEQLTRSNVKAKKIETLKVPELDQKELLERTYGRKKPFSSEDKGFKDTLIWLSVLSDAKANPETDYVVCTTLLHQPLNNL